MNQHKPLLRLAYSDFWKSFDAESYFLTTLLRRRFDVRLSDDPDLLIFSVYGDGDFRRYRCKRLMFIGENVRPDFAAADFVISSDWLSHPRHFRSPWWAQWIQPRDLVLSGDDLEAPARTSRKFCSIVISNRHSLPRIRFFERLSKYKPVDSGGSYMNTVGGPVANKLAFIRNYKFNICFENSMHPGYTTEKLPEALLARTLPIYWGDPTADREFDPDNFIWIKDLRQMDDAIERVIAADRDDAVYSRYFAKPPLLGNQLPGHCDRDFGAITEFLQQVVISARTPVARRPFYRTIAQGRHAIRSTQKRLRIALAGVRRRLGV